MNIANFLKIQRITMDKFKIEKLDCGDLEVYGLEYLIKDIVKKEPVAICYDKTIAEKICNFLNKDNNG